MALEFLSPLHKASRQISVHLERATRDLGVSPSEGHVLTYLRSYGPVAVGELVRVFGFKASTLTSLLDRLEAAGLLCRSTNPRDRRSLLVEVTPDGRALTAELDRLLAELEAEIRSRLADADRAGFRTVMASIAEVTGVHLREERER